MATHMLADLGWVRSLEWHAKPAGLSQPFPILRYVVYIPYCIDVMICDIEF